MLLQRKVEWFRNESASVDAPALAFYHIPLPEYQTAVDAGLPVSGNYLEGICYQPVNNGFFGAMATGGVVAGFCGHDHTNDFCVLYEGIQLCYEGSPGFQVSREFFFEEGRVWGGYFFLIETSSTMHFYPVSSNSGIWKR